MAYSTNPITIARRQALLAPFLRGDPEIVLISTDEASARKKVYQLRECFNIARRFPREYAALLQAADSYLIRVVGNRVLAARERASTLIPSAPVSVSFAIGLAGVVQAWIDHPIGTSLEILEVADEGQADEISTWAENMNLDLVWQGKKLTIR